MWRPSYGRPSPLTTASACRASWTIHRSATCPWWASRWAFCRPVARRTAARWLERRRSAATEAAAAVCRIASAGRDTACGRNLPAHTATSLERSRCKPCSTDPSRLQHRDERVIRSFHSIHNVVDRGVLIDVNPAGDAGDVSPPIFGWQCSGIWASNCHQMPDFKAKMHQIRFRLGLRPRPRWGANSAPPNPLARLRE